MTHKGQGDTVFGIHAGVQGVDLDGMVQCLSMGGGQGMQTAVGGECLIVQHLRPRHTHILTRTRRKEKGKQKE